MAILKKYQRIKWRVVFVTLGINLATMLIVVWAGYVFWDFNFLEEGVISKFKTANAPFFYNWNQFYLFLVYAFKATVFEESWARLPSWVLVNTKLKYRLPLAIAALVMLGGIWAKGHVYLWPVFISGLIWGGAVIKTRSLWVAGVCHGTANLSIYSLIKVLQYLQFIT